MKITFIGAGSFKFTAKLVGDILSFPELTENLTISFMDIDDERLKITEAMVKRMVESQGLKIKIESTLDRRRALKGSHYVINLILVGGLELYKVDMEIPEKYGIRQTVGDTIGPGGIFRGLRTIPVLLDTLKEMEELCPEAIFLNYTNPMAINTWAMYKGSGIKAYGLCHSVQGTHNEIASYLGIGQEKLISLAAGINHSSWFLKLEYDDKDMYPLLKEKVEKDPVVKKGIWDKNIDRYWRDTVRFDLLLKFGYFPAESSTHHAEYNPYYLKDEGAIKKYNISFWGPENDKKIYLEYLEEVKKEIAGEEIKVERSNEYASLIIHSLETGQLRKCNVNVENTGLITNLLNSCCVEVPCLVGKEGIMPIHIGNLPLSPASYCSRIVFAQALTVEAAFTGNKDYVYQALLADSLTSSILRTDEVVDMADEFFEQEEKYLMQFKN